MWSPTACALTCVTSWSAPVKTFTASNASGNGNLCGGSCPLANRASGVGKHWMRPGADQPIRFSLMSWNTHSAAIRPMPRSYFTALTIGAQSSTQPLASTFTATTESQSATLMTTASTTFMSASLPVCPTAFFAIEEMERSKTSPNHRASVFWRTRLAHCLPISTTTAARM